MELLIAPIYMISYIKGKIKYATANSVILENNNIGYQVFVPASILFSIKDGTELELFTHQYVREDALCLYGFKTQDELELFEALISVSGVGPKSAIGVLSVAKAAEIRSAVAAGDSHLLTKVPGIGRKTAERVVLELKEKMAIYGEKHTGRKSSFGSDELEALVQLGYSRPQAQDALRQVSPDIQDVSQRIKEALKNLG